MYTCPAFILVQAIKQGGEVKVKWERGVVTGCVPPNPIATCISPSGLDEL